jgi:hypothetical protein
MSAVALWRDCAVNVVLADCKSFAARDRARARQTPARRAKSLLDSSAITRAELDTPKAKARA